MQARMTNPALTVPDAMPALAGLGKALVAAAAQGGVPMQTLNLAYVRASQINGCSVCVDMHSQAAKKAGETDQRLFAVAAWREAPFFTDAERAALALTEGSTRLSDRDDPVPDEIWDEASRHYDEASLSTLVLAIATVNLWNRLNATTRQVAGSIPT